MDVYSGFSKYPISNTRFIFPQKISELRSKHMTKRFSISFNEDEYQALEKMLQWYEENLGLQLSRCSLIKHLLFQEFKDVERKSLI